MLGVDEWARRKGHTYGTVLVDLERRKPVDLLDDRSTESFARWLTEHPGVEIITRDRSEIYAEGARQGAPDAVQVADRWHLLKNVGDVVERVLHRHRPALEEAAQQTRTQIHGNGATTSEETGTPIRDDPARDAEEAAMPSTAPSPSSPGQRA